ncbi:MAG: response regulator [Candidatus Acidiferrales bacterium]
MAKSVFIVDDSLHTLSAVRTLIETETGFRVCGEASDGVEALEKLRQLKPDLVILDFCLPRMNGLEVARRLREENRTVPVILFSWHAEVFPQESATRLRLAVVSKGGSADDVARKAKELLGAI